MLNVSRARPSELDMPMPAAAEPRPGTRRTTKCTISLVSARAEFDALEEPWNHLFESAARPHQLFQSFNWSWHWANHFLDGGQNSGGNRTLSIVAGWKDGRLVMLWPLVGTRSAGLKQLSWMGEPVGQYGDVLVEDAPDTLDLLRQGWAFVRSLGADLVHLRKVRADAAIAPLLAANCAVPMLSVAAPYLDFTGTKDFASYERRYPAKLRSSRRRYLRRLSETAAVTFEQHSCGPTAQSLVGSAIKMKHAWLRERGLVSPALRDPGFERFFMDVALGKTRAIETRLSVLRSDSAAIAVEISFGCKGQVFGHVIAYETAYAKQGIGVVLAEYSIRTAHEHGYVRFDMLAPADAYKLDWADDVVAVNDWAMPQSLAGKLYARAWLGAGRPWLKSAANGMPAGLGRMLSAIGHRASPHRDVDRNAG